MVYIVNELDMMGMEDYQIPRIKLDGKFKTHTEKYIDTSAPRR